VGKKGFAILRGGDRMKQYLCIVLIVVFAMGLFSVPAFAAVTKKSLDLGEIEYVSQWSYGVFEEVTFTKFQPLKGPVEWTYLLKIKVANPRKLSIEPAQLIFNNWYYDVDTFFTDVNNWRPYMLGQQIPNETNQLITDINNANRLIIKVILSDGTEERVELPQNILEEWKSVIRFKQ